jgi:hypothetical protein
MSRVCATRALKNALRLQGVAPHIIPSVEPPQGFASVVEHEILARLHSMAEAELEPFPELLDVVRAERAAAAAGSPDALAANPTFAAGPLFSGTIHFVQIKFNLDPPTGSVLVEDGDLKTAIQYAKLAIGPISAYAGQYGPNSLAVADDFLRFEVNLPTGSYNDATLIGWVNAIASANGLSGSDCLIIMNPVQITDTDAPRDTIGGYHNKANLPYCLINMFGTGVTVQDKEFAYAEVLSHEIAEMTVDPDANQTNPEVCDPCAGNCNNSWVDVFGGANNAYLQTSRDNALPPDFSFYVAGIVQPASSGLCPPPDSACVYAPPASPGS